MELVDEKTKTSENHQDNGATPSNVTQLSLPHSPLTDASVSSEPLPLLPRSNSDESSHLESTDEHPEVRFKASDNVLFSVYQYWVHQNPGTHQDVGINEDGKWQDMWEKI